MTLHLHTFDQSKMKIEEGEQREIEEGK
ncbi:uncharacterized protein G2W53_028708 [Senna tora]|uniref:Uncharacterized protein n=1 Tax=Senna tora TaxID=362788 RepID=A0A834TCS4_9FABA|nr:uncharacterized protein G2W53_028708 [Senna tora]